MTAYYNNTDKEVYGYVDSDLGTVFGVSVGWYTLNQLFSVVEIPYGGVVTSLEDTIDSDAIFIVLTEEFYIYQNGWTKLAFGYENSKFDIKWDGDKTGRFALDMSMLGYAKGVYFVKINDTALSEQDIIGGVISRLSYSSQDTYEDIVVDETHIDRSSFPGAYIVAQQVVVVHNQSLINAAIGLPDGTITNGTYFHMYDSYNYTSRFTSRTTVKKIDGKYLDLSGLNLSPVATSGSYDDLTDKPTKLSEFENDSGFITASDIPEKVTSWNDLTDKPFYERVEMGDTLTWDENTEDRETCLSAYKVSNAVPTIDELKKGGTVRYYKDGAEKEASFGVDEIRDTGYGYQIVVGGRGTALHIVPVDTTVNGVAVSSGTYFGHSGELLGITKSFTINDYTGFETTILKPIEEKYLPDNVVLEGELITKGYQTEEQVTTLINNALGVIENGTY